MEELPKRKKGRLTGYDYSANGSYYITVCTKDKKHILGHAVGGGVLDAPYVRLSKYGAMVRDALLEMDTFYDDITINHYVIMPNHIHFILSICGEGGPSRTPAPTNESLLDHGSSRTPAPTNESLPDHGSSRTPTPTNARLPAFLSAWKRLTNKKTGFSLWQRGYYDHIIRCEADHLRIWQYMDENPVRWTEDEYYFE